MQLSVLARLALPEGKLGSCPGDLIYEALKDTSDQKYLPHWPAPSTRDPRLELPIKSFSADLHCFLGPTKRYLRETLESREMGESVSLG